LLGTLGLTIPAWQRNQAERARARVDAEVALSEENAAGQQLRARITRAHSNLAASAERLALFDASVMPPLDESFVLLTRGFEAGELGLLDVAVARERFLNARLGALRAYADFYAAVIELESAIGTELSPDATSPADGGAR
jgi:cobalt-zinc-cadmium efflux system outer membrane protein